MTYETLGKFHKKHLFRVFHKSVSETFYGMLIFRLKEFLCQYLTYRWFSIFFIKSGGSVMDILSISIAILSVIVSILALEGVQISTLMSKIPMVSKKWGPVGSKKKSQPHTNNASCVLNYSIISGW